MGILDDAIREHLDLKRKHGAREGDVQQLEDEAFGPPTRPDEPDFPERPPTGEEAVVAEAATEEGVAEPPLEEPEAFAEPEARSGGFFDQDLAEAPPASELSPPAAAEPPPPPAPAAEPLPAPPAEEPPPSADEPEANAGEPTVEHPAPEPPAEAEAEEAEVLEVDEEFEEFRDTEGEEGEDEDVLEETPEFLRDTPENERLWFEQGEPKDFDFEDSDEGEDRPA